MNPQDIESYIAVRANMLAAALGSKESQPRAELFVKHLKHIPYPVLKKAFDQAEVSFEKMPSVKKLSSFCAEFMPSQSWRYDFKPGVDRQGIPCFIDPDPDCDACHQPWSKHPTQTCAVIVDKRGARYMYKPQDCPEGQAFLNKMRELSGKQQITGKSA